MLSMWVHPLPSPSSLTPSPLLSPPPVHVSTALVPAYPQVLFLRGDGTLFSSFVAQISLKGFPQLLLFEDGLLKVPTHTSHTPQTYT